jgi:hypothetical protein
MPYNICKMVIGYDYKGVVKWSLDTIIRESMFSIRGVLTSMRGNNIIRLSYFPLNIMIINLFEILSVFLI